MILVSSVTHEYLLIGLPQMEAPQLYYLCFGFVCFFLAVLIFVRPVYLLIVSI